jgi:hypothetical protein
MLQLAPADELQVYCIISPTSPSVFFSVQGQKPTARDDAHSAPLSQLLPRFNEPLDECIVVRIFRHDLRFPRPGNSLVE